MQAIDAIINEKEQICDRINGGTKDTGQFERKNE